MTGTKQIRHVVRFGATPRAIHQALMDSKKHAAFTGAPANVDYWQPLKKVFAKNRRS